MAGFDQGRDGGRASLFRPGRFDRDQAGDGAAQHVDHGGAVCFVFDELGGGLGPAGGQVSDGGNGADEVEVAVGLVEEPGVGAAASPDLPAHVVGPVGAFEGHVPGGDDLVEADRDPGAVCSFGPLGVGVGVVGEPGSLEDVAGRGGRAALEQGVPGAGADLAAALLPLFAGASPGGDHVFADLAAEDVGFALGGVVVGLGGDVDDAPVGAVLAFLEPSGEVVVSPPGLDDDDGGAGAEAGDGDFGPPVLDGFAPCFGVGVFAVFVGVVDDQQVDRFTGQRTLDSHTVDRPVVSEEIPLIGRGRGGIDADAEGLGVLVDVIPDAFTPAAGDAVRVGHDRDPQPRVPGEHPCRKPAAGALRLSFLRGHGDHEPVAAAFGHVDERGVDEVERGSLVGARVEGEGEFPWRVPGDIAGPVRLEDPGGGLESIEGVHHRPVRSVEAHGDLPEVAGHDLGCPVRLGWGEVEVAEDLLDDRGQERALLLGELHAALFDAGGDRGLGDVDEVFTFFLPQLDPDVDCGGFGGVDALEFRSGFLGAFGDAPDGGVGSEFTDFLGEPVDGSGGAVDLFEECVAGIDFSGESEHGHGGAGLLLFEASFGGGFGDGGAASVGAAYGLSADGPFPALVAGAA